MFCNKYDVDIYRVFELNYRNNDNYYKTFFIEYYFHINSNELLNDYEIKQKILKEIFNYKNSKITIDVEYYIENEKHNHTINTSFSEKFENEFIKTTEDKYNRLISEIDSFNSTTMREFEGELKHTDLKHLSNSKVQIKKIIINVIMNNKWNNFLIIFFRDIF